MYIYHADGYFLLSPPKALWYKMGSCYIRKAAIFSLSPVSLFGHLLIEVKTLKNRDNLAPDRWPWKEFLLLSTSCCSQTARDRRDVFFCVHFNFFGLVFCLYDLLFFFGWKLIHTLVRASSSDHVPHVSVTLIWFLLVGASVDFPDDCQTWLRRLQKVLA